MAMDVPRIACFHGGGSNSGIFAFQCRRLQHLLADHYELVFFDAPYEREGGPGVLPFFADYAPFRTWIAPASSSVEEEDGLDRVLYLMHSDTLRRKEEARLQGKIIEPGPWVGAMGFSQGTRVVSGLLWRQQQQQQQQQQKNPTIFNPRLEFGIVCMGSAKPMGAEQRDATTDVPRVDEEPITIPTLHLHGLRDAILPKSRDQLAIYFHHDAVRLMEINYHHAMPWYKPDVEAFVQLIKETHKRGLEVGK
ncbi:phospholipase/carboxylesterase [Pleomassaria siparia CBS 279.74]|uniref:Phospholipase/carboxylesterase n=1 Tax=Pleomassaria siparia CBS 279.74 TaxID=1314801 RepID=A0A6G1JU78_9PLEO|nr:phospholipase/carboxylesterase [Pleomassaria siparia CBS 279.74]